MEGIGKSTPGGGEEPSGRGWWRRAGGRSWGVLGARREERLELRPLREAPPLRLRPRVVLLVQRARQGPRQRDGQPQPLTWPAAKLNQPRTDADGHGRTRQEAVARSQTWPDTGRCGGYGQNSCLRANKKKSAVECRWKGRMHCFMRRQGGCR